mgnify:CR=1 FL=1
MLIGGIAKATGTKVNTIRFYEEIGLMPEAARTAAGQRTYTESEVKRLSFIRRARKLGFSIDETRSLLVGLQNYRSAFSKPSWHFCQSLMRGPLRYYGHRTLAVKKRLHLQSLEALSS